MGYQDSERKIVIKKKGGTERERERKILTRKKLNNAELLMHPDDNHYLGITMQV